MSQSCLASFWMLTTNTKILWHKVYTTKLLQDWARNEVIMQQSFSNYGQISKTQTNIDQFSSFFSDFFTCAAPKEKMSWLASHCSGNKNLIQKSQRSMAVLSAKLYTYFSLYHLIHVISGSLNSWICREEKKKEIYLTMEKCICT